MTSGKPSVVLVHGLWMKGLVMFMLGWRLKRAGYRVYRFSYHSMTCNLSENAGRLNEFLLQVKGDTVHFVGHSLGGLVIRRLFHDFPEQRPGRIVTLGTPHNGSYIAGRFSFIGFFRRMLGHSFPALIGKLYPWEGRRELGSIAGTLSIGVGRLLRNMPRPNDGTVTQVSTRLENMSDHVTVKTSHNGLLFSRKASEQVIEFLAHGRFDHEKK